MTDKELIDELFKQVKMLSEITNLQQDQLNNLIKVGNNHERRISACEGSLKIGYISS